jgi:adenine/guanine phosphoribosyltransferase-like PRPP-binding protein
MDQFTGVVTGLLAVGICMGYVAGLLLGEKLIFPRKYWMLPKKDWDLVEDNNPEYLHLMHKDFE